MKQPTSPSDRRSFLSNAGAASLAAVALGGTAAAQQAAPAHWQPARHPQDDWMDEIPGKHRLVFDTTSATALGEAMLFANNFIIVNRSEYGLTESELAIIVIARHRSTAFAFNDAIWTKYGKQISGMSGLDDSPRTTNTLNARVRGLTLDSLASRGVQFAVCAMATIGLASSIADEVGATADSVNAELIANLVTNARMVPAGIVAVNRAQERGYTLVSA